jgi:hypothetical protein
MLPTHAHVTVMDQPAIGAVEVASSDEDGHGGFKPMAARRGNRRSAALDPGQRWRGAPVHSAAMQMARYDWKYFLLLVASLALAAGAICILLFAM